jgi:murein DD-endopeptidase MepM/ murein hydrolase activator NlpD
MLLATALVAFGSPVPVLRAQSAGPQYIVQDGDTLYGIALSFGLTVEALQAANPGVEPSSLAVGRALVIPGFEGVTGTLATHSLEPGESLDSLGLRLGLSRQTLIRLNRLVNPSLPYLGQAVVVVDQPDLGPPQPRGVTYDLLPGQGLLALAAGLGQSPWSLAAANHWPVPGQAAPGQAVFVPGGDQPTSALPFPLSALQLGPLPVVQGHTLAIRLSSARPVTVTGQLGDVVLHFAGGSVDTASSGQLVALQGIYRLADPNLYPLALHATDAGGGAVEFVQLVPVRAGDYAADRPLSVDPATLDPAVTVPESEQIQSLATPVTPIRYWDGLFVLPSVGALRSLFGSLRAYNGGPYESFHGGVDFSGGEDRAITAPAPGVVVFTGKLAVRGNATVIDHGWGVYTGYWHQSSILVQVGEHVTTGQVIGYNGATGRVTGPHLHWELWVGGYQVDPLQWTETPFP